MFLYFSVIEDYYFHKISVYNDASNLCTSLMLICPWSVAITAAV